MTTATAALGLGGGAFGAQALAGGLNRLKTIQDASASMRILMGDAAEAEQMVSAVTDLAQGTPYTADQFLNMSRQMIAMGMAADQVGPSIEAIANATAASGRGAEMLDQLALVFGKVSTQGRITGTEIMSLQTAGVPALQILANSFGVTTDEMQKMISASEVDAPRAINALTHGIMHGTEGAAGPTRAYAGVLEELRETVSGALEVFKAQRNILGATFLGPLFERLPAGLNSLSEGLKGLRPAAAALGRSLAGGIERFIGWIQSPQVRTGISVFKGGLRDAANAAREMAPGMASAARAAATMFGSGALAGWRMATSLLNSFAPLLNSLADLFGRNQGVVNAFGFAVGALYLKSRLLGPALRAVDTATSMWRNTIGMMRAPLRDVTDRTTGLVTQTGLLTHASRGTLGPLGQIRMAYLEGAQQASRYARSQQLMTTNAQLLRTQMVDGLGPINRMRHAFSTATTTLRSTGAVMGSVRAATTGLATAGRSLLFALGGIPGVALTAGTALVGVLAASHGKAAAAAEEHRQKEKELQATLHETTGLITERTREEVRDSFREEDDHGTTMMGRAQSYGIPTYLLVDAATGTGDPEAYERLRREATERAVRPALEGIPTRVGPGGQQVGGWDEIRTQLEGVGVSVEDLEAALLREGSKWDEVSAKMQNLPARPGGARLTLQGLIDQMDDEHESLITMVQNVNNLRNAFDEKADETRDSTRMLHRHWEATDELRQKYEELGATVKGVTTPEQMVLEIDEPRLADVKGKLEEVGYEVQALPGVDGEPVTVIVTAQTDEAKAEFKDLITEVEDTTATARIDADVSPAKESVNSVLRMLTGLDPLTIPMNIAPSMDGAIVPPGVQIPGGATGGRVGNIIRGPGTGTSDSILAQTNTGNLLRVSNGESINTEASTRRNWPLIDAMNKGWVPPADFLRKLPGLRAGGRVDGLNPGPGWVKDLIQQMYPQVGEIGGWRPEDGFGEHSTGNAIDVMIPDWQTPYGKALGDQIAGFMLQNADALGLTHLIWQQRLFRPGDRMGSPMEDRGSPTQNHYDHVHAFFNQRGGQLPTAPVLAPGGGLGAGSGGMGGSRASSAARRRVQDAQDRVDDTAFRIEQAERRLSELSPDAKESQRAKAERDLVVAQREHQQALEALTEAQWEAAEAEADNVRGSGGKAGGPDGRSLGRDIVSGFLEAFGLDGDTFSNPLDWGIWKLFTGGANYVGGLLKNAFSDGDGNGMLRSTYPAYMGSPSSAQHGRGLGSPGPGNYGVGDGGLGGVDFADPGSAVGDTLSSLLPQVSDFLPNSQDPGPQQQQVSSVHYDQRIQIEGAGVGMKELGNEMNRRMNPQRTGYAMNVPGFRP